MNPDQQNLELARRYLDGTATADEVRALEKLLRTDAAFRRQFLRYTNVDAALGGGRLSAAAVARPMQVDRHPAWFGWLQWRPLTAAAAGLVFGMFCTSVVFAYVAPSLGKVITLLQESFESGPAPMVMGMPMEAGRWSGDYTEVVGEQQGVKPESGKRMLRFLRTDYEGKPTSEGHVGDLYRLIDMRPYRKDFADGGAVVQLSAGFNTFVFPEDEDYECSLTLYALDTETATNGSMRSRIRSDEAPLGVQKRRMKLDRNPDTWQRLTSELRLPPDTDFLMVRICIQYSRNSPSRQTFAGHYLDDVRLVMGRRNPLP